jgi:hypothetical protein
VREQIVVRVAAPLSAGNAGSSATAGYYWSPYSAYVYVLDVFVKCQKAQQRRESLATSAKAASAALVAPVASQGVAARDFDLLRLIPA